MGDNVTVDDVHNMHILCHSESLENKTATGCCSHIKAPCPPPSAVAERWDDNISRKGKQNPSPC